LCVVQIQRNIVDNELIQMENGLDLHMLSHMYVECLPSEIIIWFALTVVVTYANGSCGVEFLPMFICMSVCFSTLYLVNRCS